MSPSRCLASVASLVVLFTSAAGLSLASMSCLTSFESLVPRAEVIAIGQVLAVGHVDRGPCPEMELTSDAEEIERRPGESESDFVQRLPLQPGPGPLRCGTTVTRLTVRVTRRLRGQLPDILKVLVAGDFWPLMSCGNRTDVDTLDGMFTTLFLEPRHREWWSLDGACSLHVWDASDEARQKEIEDEVRTLLDAPRKWPLFEERGLVCSGARPRLTRHGYSCASPLRDALLTLRNSDGCVLTAHTDATGEYSFFQLTELRGAKDEFFRVEADGYAPFVLRGADLARKIDGNGLATFVLARAPAPRVGTTSRPAVTSPHRGP